MRYWLGAALLFALTVVWWFGGHTSPELPLAVEQTAPPQKHNPASNSGLKPILALPELKEQPVETFVTGLENLPASLRGTDVDGGFVLDEEGQLLPSFRTRQLFDYFLSAQGEEPLATILARITAYIYQQLPIEAAQAAEALLHNYIEYLAAADSYESVKPNMQQLDFAQLSDFKQELKTLRAGYFDAATQDAFFGEEDAYDEYTFARLEVLNNEALSATQKAERIAELTAQMPAAFQAERSELEQLSTLRTLTDELQQTNGSVEELYALRSELVGEEGAKRLAQLDEQRAQWQQRVDAWLAERQRVLSNGNLSDIDKAEQIDALRAQHFNEQETLRIKFIEKQ